MEKPPLTILLAAPRGFCAGVDRAIQIVEKALEKYGAPVYVRHEIVHNKYVVDGLKGKGAVFVEELHEIPDDGQPVIFSAHGVPKSVPEAAAARQMFFIDATCPLVSKVHREAERHHKNGRQIVLIGHKGHPEVIGTMGQLPPGAVVLVETVADVAALQVPSPQGGEGQGEGGIADKPTVEAIEFARTLRKNNTQAEKLLWGQIRDRRLKNYKFRRQHPIGAYFADFSCLEKNLIIELDGPSHDQTILQDKNRTEYLVRQGFRILRFNNEDVCRNLEGVVQEIGKALDDFSAPLTPPLSPEGRGGSLDDALIHDAGNLAWCSQTTLSVDDTAAIVAALKTRFPAIEGPHKEDICYATTNRQGAVREIAARSDALLVIGAPNSSNSNRLAEVAQVHGCPKAWLIQRAADIDWAGLEGVKTLGLTAGASAPEVLVDEVVAALRGRFDVTVEEVITRQENVVFNVPKVLAA